VRHSRRSLLPAKELTVASELGGSQISTLLETLPGIANVLRSPVADALLNIIRAAARVGDFDYADADEVVKYATRRGLLGQEEGDRVLAEVQEAEKKKHERESQRHEKGAKPRPKAKAHPKPKSKKNPPHRPAAKKKG
jgi:hypothetical protein